MNILHIDYDDFNNPYAGGGQAVTTRELYSRLPEGSRVTVITGNYPRASDEETGSMSYRRIGIGSWGPKVSLLSFWMFMPFYVLLHQKTYDLIVEFFTAPFSVSFTPFFTYKPHLAWPTALFGDDLGKKYNSPFKTIERFGIKFYRHFVASTDEMKKELHVLNKTASIDVIPYGFDKKLLAVTGHEKNYALYVGRIDIFQKGIDTLIRAWSIVASKNKNVKLVIVGNGKPDDEQALTDLIRNNHLENMVVRKGRIFGTERDRLIAECQFVICPSRYETYCIMALETLAMGKPLIYSDIKGFSWIPRDTAVRFTSDDADDLAKKCISLIGHADLRKSIAAKAKSYAKNYDWDSLAKRYFSLFRNISQKRQYES